MRSSNRESETDQQLTRSPDVFVQRLRTNLDAPFSQIFISAAFQNYLTTGLTFFAIFLYLLRITVVQTVMTSKKSVTIIPRESKQPDGTANELKRSAPASEPKPRDISKSMPSKLRRACKGAGKPATDDELEEYAKKLIQAEVMFMKRSSGRISRYIKGEISLEDLKTEFRK